MEEQTFYISEVSRQVGAEPHVLRYWEEELGLEIKRNSQGKRCYSRENIELFLQVKRLREKGMQLKAAREILGEDERFSKQWIPTALEEGAVQERTAANPFKKEQSPGKLPGNTGDEKAEKIPFGQEDQGASSEIPFPDHPEYTVIPAGEPQDSMQVFERLLDGIIERALEKNNEKLVRETCDLLLAELENRLEEKWQAERDREELAKELFKDGLRESAAASSVRQSLWKRWKRWLENLL